MAALTSPVDYDDMTGDDLFNSFMNVALTEECLNCKTSFNNNDSPTEMIMTNETGNVESSVSSLDEESSSNKEPVREVYPLYQPPPLLVKMKEPVYETCNFTKDTNGIVNANTVNCQIPDDKDSKINPAVKVDPYSVVNYTVEIVNSNPVDPNMLQQNTDYDQINVEETSTKDKQDLASLYAVPDKNKKSKESTPSNYASVDVIPVSKNSVLLGPSPEKSEYAEVILKEPTSPSSSNDYEAVSDLKLPKELANEVKSNRHSFVFDAKQIAYGNQQIQNGNERQMYNNIQNTIENGSNNSTPSRSAHSSTKEKKHFFGFGKKHSEHPISPTRASSERSQREFPELHNSPVLRRRSSVLVVSSGYMFKQGGTGFTPKNWRLRWFELKKDNCLYYYKSEQDHIANGAVMLLKYTVLRAPEVNKRFGFKLVKSGARTYYFAANSEEEMRKWMKNLGEAAKNAVHDHTSIPECSLKNVSIPALSISEPDCHGFIHKQGDSRKSWKKRYCVLKYGCLFYYEDMSDGVAIGVFKLHHYTITTNTSTRFGFDAIPPIKKMRTYHFYVESEVDFKRWVEAMKYSVASFKG